MPAQEKESSPEVEIIFAADDIRGTLNREDGKNWVLTVEDSGEDAPDYHPAVSRWRFAITELQAAAVMALFIGLGECDDAPVDVVAKLYAIAEPVFHDVPRNLRIIP